MTLNMIHGHWLVNTHQSLHVLHDHWMINMFYSFMILQSLDNTCLHHITNKVTIRPSYLDTINDPSMTHQWFLVNDTSMSLHNSINNLHDSIHFLSSLMSVHSIISHDSALLASMTIYPTISPFVIDDNTHTLTYALSIFLSPFGINGKGHPQVRASFIFIFFSYFH